MVVTSFHVIRIRTAQVLITQCEHTGPRIRVYQCAGAYVFTHSHYVTTFPLRLITPSRLPFNALRARISSADLP